MQIDLKRTELPSFERLHEAFEYCPSTGSLKWKIQPRGRGKKNERVGGITPHGYTQVVLDRRNFLAHRAIWKMQTGNEPPVVIDHRDGDGTNNAWDNLREATHTGNTCNAARRSDNTSGVKGISYNKKNKKWRSYVILKQKQFETGNFYCFGQAIKAMRRVRRELHGEFARAA